MQGNHLVTMANQIGDFFRYQGDEPTAMQGIAAHVHHFWSPAMRSAIVAWLDEHNGEGLEPLVKAALVAYRDRLLGPLTQVPGEEALEEPRGGGDAG